MGRFISRTFQTEPDDRGDVFQDKVGKEANLLLVQLAGLDADNRGIPGKDPEGYTIKDAIKCNFVIPAIFSTIWMGLLRRLPFIMN